MIRGIAHVALYTDRFEETVAFYKEAFDARELGAPDTARRGVWLGLGDSVIEIFESAPLPEGAFKHIALWCDNTDEAFERAVRGGAAAYVAPRDSVFGGKKGLRLAFVKGINGEQIELCSERE